MTMMICGYKCTLAFSHGLVYTGVCRRKRHGIRLNTICDKKIILCANEISNYKKTKLEHPQM